MTRTFDRIPQPDTRNIPVRRLIAQKPLRSYTWRCQKWLDQGQDGACVGFSWAHELVARPVEWPVGETDAHNLYQTAKTLDEWPGEDYDGTSVLAGAKACRQAGFLNSFYWATTVTDLALGLGYHGPAVLGVWWREGMMTPDPSGQAHATGEKVGGHAILCNAVDVYHRRFRLHQSWGTSWGDHGDCWVSWADMEVLLGEDGEACFASDKPLLK